MSCPTRRQGVLVHSVHPRHIAVVFRKVQSDSIGKDDYGRVSRNCSELTSGEEAGGCQQWVLAAQVGGAEEGGERQSGGGALG